MKIVSDFKDYYDCVMRTNMNPEDIWVRDIEKEVFARNSNCFDIQPFQYHTSTLFSFFIGFCGKVYPCLVVINAFDGIQGVAYTIDDVEQFNKDKLINVKKTWNARKNIQDTKEFFNKTYTSSVFVDKQIPVYIKWCSNRYIGYQYFKKKELETDLVEKNVFINTDFTLNSLQFYRIFDPFTAYQEIVKYKKTLNNK